MATPGSFIVDDTSEDWKALNYVCERCGISDAIDIATGHFENRMVKPARRAASSKSPLDAIRPTTWSPEWKRELLEIVAVLSETLAMIPTGVDLLDRILDGLLTGADEIPEPPAWMRHPPNSKGDNDAQFSNEGLG